MNPEPQPEPARSQPSACEACLRHAALLGALAGHIEHRRGDRQKLAALLALPDDALARAVGAVGVTAPDPPPVRPGSAICRHDPGYPRSLAELDGAPAVLHLGGQSSRALELMTGQSVAIVGARQPTDYGRQVAFGLSAALASTGVCIVSGLALGIDTAAHLGALSGSGPTLAVMPGGVDVAYPAGARALHARLTAIGAVVSEMPSGAQPRRWSFVARNRIIAALTRVTVVVEARARSGSLITAGYARDLGREVAALPGPVTSDRSDGTNALIRDGAQLVRDARDVLDLLYGVGTETLVREPRLPAHLRTLLGLVRAGHDTPGGLVAAGMDVQHALAGLAELELAGCVRRGLSGRYIPCRPHRHAVA